MPNSDFEVVVIGGGAAGVAAARRLREASIGYLLIEARSRLGGRAWTVTDTSGFTLDLGCGWLHSADRNPWVGVAKEQGAEIDKTPPPWTRPSLDVGFPRADQDEFQKRSRNSLSAPIRRRRARPTLRPRRSSIRRRAGAA